MVVLGGFCVTIERSAPLWLSNVFVTTCSVWALQSSYPRLNSLRAD